MQKTYLLLLSLALLSTPLVQSHDGGVGAPKPHCEHPDAKRVHEYGPGNEFAIGGKVSYATPWFYDSNRPTDDTLNLPLDVQRSLARAVMDGGTVNDGTNCPLNETWDFHFEYAVGGAWLFAGDEALACWGGYPDHDPRTLIRVEDAVLTPLGVNVEFDVYVDTMNNGPFPTTPDCGDFESEIGINCVGSCVPWMGPGRDGTYQIFVHGTTGHIYN